MIGTILNNRYELLEKIGEGGMSVVYKAKCHKLNRYDAVKILKKEYSNDPAVVEKFKREATAVANLSDTNIINIFDVGTQGDIHYIVMEYVKGKTLKDIILENVRLSYERTIDIAIQIAKALDCAHRNNIIHRDVKPQNILVTEDGVVKVTDFGIAKASSTVTITNSNKVIGSAHYFSPEQAKGTFVDGRADIYSLGIVMYEMVTGKVPFDAESPVTIAIKHIQDTPVAPREINSSIPESLSRMIMKAIEKDPNNRYQSAREMLMDLLRIQKDLNYEIIPTAVENDYTKVMNPVNISKDADDEVENEDEDGVNNKTRKILIGVLIGVIVLVLGVVAALTLGGGAGKSNNTQTGEVTKSGDIAVPDVIGMTEAEAKQKIESAGLTYTKTDEVSDPTIPAGSVVRTFPEAGTKLQAKGEVRVRLSKGPGKDTVPNLKGVDLEQAKAMLTGTGFELVVTDKQYNDTVPENSIINQTPDADSDADKGTKIQVVVSLGTKIPTVMVPKLIDLKIDDAKKLLTSTKLKVGAITTKTTTDATQVGKVYYQSVETGKNVQEGYSIDLSYYVAEAKPQVAVPDFKAEKTIKAAKADPLVTSGKIILSIPDGAADDWVISGQDKTAGSMVDEGTIVKLTAAAPTP